MPGKYKHDIPEILPPDVEEAKANRRTIWPPIILSSKQFIYPQNLYVKYAECLTMTGLHQEMVSWQTDWSTVGKCYDLKAS